MIGDRFARLLNNNIADSEKVNYDLQSNKMSAIEYIGISDNQSTESDATWGIIKYQYNTLGLLETIRFRDNIKWSERNQGW